MVERSRGDRSGRDEEPARGRGRDEAPARGGRDEGRGGSRRTSSRGSGSSSGFQYQGRSREDVESRAQGKGDFDSFLKDHIKVFKVHNGDNCIRILPPTWKPPEGKKQVPHWGLDLHVHYGVGADRESYLDLNRMKNEPDPIHEEYERQIKAGVPKEELRDLRGTRRSLVYLIDRDDEGAGVQAWAMPAGLDRDISGVSVDKGTSEVLNIDHPDDGYDVNFTKTGEGLKTNYGSVSIARRSSLLGDDAWLDYAIDNPLPDQLVFYSYEHINKVFGGGGTHRERDDRSDDRSSGGRRGESSSDRSSRSDAGSGRARVPDSRNADDGRSRNDAAPELTWESVHSMTGDELDALVEDRELDINPQDAENDEELAKWICEDLKLEKEAEAPRGRRSARAEEPAAGGDRLAQMRAERNRR